MTVPDARSSDIEAVNSAPEAKEEFKAAMRSAFYLRLELFLTLLLDGVMLVGAYFTSAGLAWVVARYHPGNPHWSIRVLVLLLDVGIVGTALTVTVFDLAKRMKTAYRSFTQT